MSKPNWACSSCGMYSSRRWSVERHILNLHNGNSNVVPFVDYLLGRQSGIYLPKFIPFVRKNATKTVTVMDTFKDELLKGFASKAVNKALSSSPIQNPQFNFQGFGSNGAPYFYPNQFNFEPLHIIPRPEEVFGFEIYVCKKCSSIEPIIISFSDTQEGGSKMSWATCCGLKKLDEKNLNNELQQKVQAKLKYCVKTWTNNKPMLTAIRIPESLHGNSIRLLQQGNRGSISLEYSLEKNIELDIDDKNHWAPRCVTAGTIALSNDDLADFLNKTGNATFGFFTVKIKEFKGIYLMAILNDIVNRRLRIA